MTKRDSSKKLNLTFFISDCRLNVSSTLYQHRINGYLGINQQLFDLGQNRSDLYDKSETEEMIKRMEQNFDLESSFFISLNVKFLQSYSPITETFIFYLMVYFYNMFQPSTGSSSGTSIRF